jgi:glyoxylase-like metal-dependent hydrolase (beta-lactamase superfamily II)
MFLQAYDKNMIHETLPLGMFQCNCSILGDPDSREAIVVDPGDEPARILEALARHQLRVTRILLTHAHIDHVGAVAALKREFGVTVALHPADRPVYESLTQQASWTRLPPPEPFEIEEALEEGQVIPFGPGALRVLFTPGHSPGSVSFHIPEQGRVISGDVLFRGSIGRTDLPGGNYDQLIETIHAKLLTLAPETVVYPGHGGRTTIAAEAIENPFLA